VLVASKRFRKWGYCSPKVDGLRLGEEVCSAILLSSVTLACFVFEFFNYAK